MIEVMIEERVREERVRGERVIDDRREGIVWGVNLMLVDLAMLGRIITRVGANGSTLCL